MSAILAYIETVDGRPTTLSRELVLGARRLAGDQGRVIGIVIGDHGDGGGDSGLASLRGADQIVLVRLPGLPAPTSAVKKLVLAWLIEEERAALLLIPGSPVGVDLATTTAAHSDLPLVTSCQAVSWSDGELVTRSRIYGGRAEAIATTPVPAILCVNAGAFGSSEALQLPQLGQRSFELIDDGRIRVEGLEETADNEIDITRYERLLCVGRGVAGEDNIRLAQEVARRLGGELAASRQVTDRGLVAKSRQIGKSGKAVTPRVYLGFGVSGAPEHVEGMRDSGLIIAINTDPSAPIFDLADYGATCDAGALLRELARQLGETGSA